MSRPEPKMTLVDRQTAVRIIAAGILKLLHDMVCRSNITRLRSVGLNLPFRFEMPTAQVAK
jgi:hypothetical protein